MRKPRTLLQAYIEVLDSRAGLDTAIRSSVAKVAQPQSDMAIRRDGDEASRRDGYTASQRHGHKVMQL